MSAAAAELWTQTAALDVTLHEWQGLRHYSQSPLSHSAQPLRPSLPSASPAVGSPTTSSACPCRMAGHKSVGFGHAGGPAAWMLAGDFRFQEDAAKHEGWPPVPPHRLLIGIGDFPVFSQWKHWRHVGRLSLPGRMAAKRLVTWHVRFEGRALFLGVHFGSRPDARARRLADERLASVRRTLK